MIDTRPERMIRSAWRGEARSASAPNLARSFRGEPTTAIISIAQHASPKVIGNIEFVAPQASSFSSEVVSTDCDDVLLQLGVVEVAAQEVAGAQLAHPQVLGRARFGERREPRAASRASPPIERTSAPDVDQRDQQQGDEDQQLDEDEDRVRACQDHARPGRGTRPRCRRG